MPARLPGGVPDRVIVGLGNPGPRYAGTRHNVGFAVAYRLVDRLKARSLERRKEYDAWQAELGDRSLAIVTPLLFMNLSGEALLEFRERHGEFEPANGLVVVDDVYLPTGTLRLRGRGSDGGHNGLESVRLALGSEEFPRLRVGVGAPAGSGAMVDHVLSGFEPEEIPLVNEALERAENAALLWASEGVTAAMNRFNVRPRAERDDNAPNGER
jgi:PTH1 family peptidyl-tRNA hydrolase